MPPPAKRRRLAAVAPSPTFTPFPRLPVEVRLKIWGAAANDDKAVLKMIPARSGTAEKNHFTVYRAGANGFMVPALLQTCRESRDECTFIPETFTENGLLKRKLTPRELSNAQDRGAKTYREALTTITEDVRKQGERKAGHACWELCEFKNKKIEYSKHKPITLWVSFENDTFWSIYLRNSHYQLFLSISFWTKLRQFVGCDDVLSNLNKVKFVSDCFPALESITHLLHDLYCLNYDGEIHAFPCAPEELIKRESVQGGRVQGYERGPLDEFNEYEAGVTQEVEARVRAFDPYVMGPPADDDMIEKLHKQLRFRFEVQYIEKEVPELVNKGEYKRKKRG